MHAAITLLLIVGSFVFGCGAEAAENVGAEQRTGKEPVQSPIVIDMAHTAEIWRNEGGAKDGWRYLDNLDFAIELDFDRLIEWHGARGHLSLIYNNGSSLSELTGDVMVASNIETGIRALRVFEAWIEQDLQEGIGLRVGLYDLNSEFDALDSASLFIGSAHGVGIDLAQTGENGPSIFPVTSLAARLSFDASPTLTLRAAVLDAVPGDPAHPARTAVKLGNGALVIGEADWQTGPGRILAGAWGYTNKLPAVSEEEAGLSRGAYLRGEICLQPFGEDCGIALFARAGVAAAAVNPFGIYLGGGVVGNLAHDWTFGVAIAHARASSGLERADPSAGAETVLELTAQHRLTDWLSIQPNLQFVSNPGARSGNADAMVAGLRIVTQM